MNKQNKAAPLSFISIGSSVRAEPHLGSSLASSLLVAMAPHFRSTLNGAEVAGIRRSLCRPTELANVILQKQNRRGEGEREREGGGYGIVRVFVRAPTSVLAKASEHERGHHEPLNSPARLDLFFSRTERRDGRGQRASWLPFALISGKKYLHLIPYMYRARKKSLYVVGRMLQAS